MLNDDFGWDILGATIAFWMLILVICFVIGRALEACA